MCNFLSALRLGVSPSFYNKKADEFGLLYNAKMVCQKKNDEALLASCIGEDLFQEESLPPTVAQISPAQRSSSEVTNQYGNANHVMTGSASFHTLPAVSSNLHGGLNTDTSVCREPLRSSTGSIGTPKEIGPGCKIAFDNIDIFQKVREMTEDNQNKDHHWINHVKVSNRISGNHLPDDKPLCDSVLDLDNYKVIPSVPEHISQRGNYILLIERVMAEEIPCLSFCKDVVTAHIPHCHSKEMSAKSEKVFAF